MSVEEVAGEAVLAGPPHSPTGSLGAGQWLSAHCMWPSDPVLTQYEQGLRLLVGDPETKALLSSQANPSLHLPPLHTVLIPAPLSSVLKCFSLISSISQVSQSSPLSRVHSCLHPALLPAHLLPWWGWESGTAPSLPPSFRFHSVSLLPYSSLSRSLPLPHSFIPFLPLLPVLPLQTTQTMLSPSPSTTSSPSPVPAPHVCLSSSPPLPVPFSASLACPPACVGAGLTSSSEPPLVYLMVFLWDPSFGLFSPWLFTCLRLELRPFFHYSETTPRVQNAATHTLIEPHKTFVVNSQETT